MSKDNPLKCAVDIRSAPPSAYTLPDDGRKAKHLCRLRHSLAFRLATYANPDGTSIRPSRDRMASELGVSRRTVARLLVDLKTLGFLVDDGWHTSGTMHVRKRSLNVPAIQQAASGSRGPDTKAEGQIGAGSVPDTKAERQIGAGRGPDSFGTQPPLSDRPSLPPIQPPTLPTPTDKNPQPVNGNGRVCVNISNPFDHAMRLVHTDMLGSQWKKGEKEQVEKLIAEHGWEKFVAAQHLYWQNVGDPAAFDRTLYKWTGLLNSFAGWLPKLTPKLLNKLAYERWVATPEGAAEEQRRIEQQLKQQIAAEAEKARRDLAAHLAKRTPKEIEFARREERAKAIVDDAVQRCLAGEKVMAPAEMEIAEGLWPTITVVKSDTEFEVERNDATGLLVCTVKP